MIYVFDSNNDGVLSMLDCPTYKEILERRIKFLEHGNKEEYEEEINRLRYELSNYGYKGWWDTPFIKD
jgi:hypothetical protein